MAKSIFELSDKFNFDSPLENDWLQENKTNNTNSNNNPKSPINILIVLDASGKKQFDDTKNTIWKYFHVLTLSDYSTIKDFVSKYSFKNFCLVHHGNVYSTVSLPKDEQIVFGVGRIEQMEQIIAKVGKKPFLEMDEEYFTSLHEQSKTMFTTPYPIEELKAFCCLGALIGNIKSGGNYFSVACDEADDPKLLEKLSTYASNNIKLFANSNYSTISRSTIFSYGSKKIAGYGSILNSFLTSSNKEKKISHWIDNSGWKYYDMSQSKLIVTNKDLWIYSKHKSKIYALISREKYLTEEQAKKEFWAQTYFSKSFEKWYVKNWQQAAYENFIRGIEAKYPDFKQ